MMFIDNPTAPTVVVNIDNLVAIEGNRLDFVSGISNRIHDMDVLDSLVSLWAQECVELAIVQSGPDMFAINTFHIEFSCEEYVRTKNGVKYDIFGKDELILINKAHTIASEYYTALANGEIDSLEKEQIFFEAHKPDSPEIEQMRNALINQNLLD